MCLFIDLILYNENKGGGNKKGVRYHEKFISMASVEEQDVRENLWMYSTASDHPSHLPPLHRIPEGQAEAGSLAAGKLRSLEDQLSRAKQKIHSFQKLSGDGRSGGVGAVCWEDFGT